MPDDVLIPVADYVPSHGSHSRRRYPSINIQPTHGAHSFPKYSCGSGFLPFERFRPKPVNDPQIAFSNEVMGRGEGMSKESAEGCQHIGQLTALPTMEEAATRAQKLKSVPLPWLPAGFYGHHPKLGNFKIDDDDGDRVEWNLVGEEPDSASLNELSFNPSRALQRLSLGWLISALHELEGIHIADEIPDPKEAMKELSRWNRKAETYLKWAIAPVEKMVT
ncbi:hypothetical protein [Novosphingobium acidiphilum]|jgi:hypothetical protein|uniref:hypothetical protein n=1 Tax=Novosphingobium acidiphilum TaxID=505248 RepID=UPI0012EB46E2|nr:hypothetical protein [Novosphingobium acidiphilum]